MQNLKSFALSISRSVQRRAPVAAGTGAIYGIAAFTLSQAQWTKMETNVPTAEKTVMVIRASPRSDGHSNRIADRFIETLQRTHPQVTIKDWCLHSKLDIPEFGQAAIDGKQKDASSSSRAVWSQVTAVINEFTSADGYVVATPMWNFGIPAKLKNFVDVVVQSGLTFDQSADGKNGLLKGKKVLFICARAGAYAPGSDSDFQLPYLQKVWRVMGVEDQQSIPIDNTWKGPESDNKPLLLAEKMAYSWADGLSENGGLELTPIGSSTLERQRGYRRRL